MRHALPALALAIVACAAPPAPSGGSTGACTPADTPLRTPSVDAPPPGVPAPPTPGPFSYAIADPPVPAAGEADTAQVDGQPMRYQAGILMLDFVAADVTWDGPEGKIPGILAHHALIEPVLRDFDLEVVEQSRIPQRPAPTVNKGDGITVTPPPIREWLVRPSFLVRARNAETEPLDGLQADATTLGLRGTWIFPHRAAAGLFARLARLQRRLHCYDIRLVGLNVYMTPL